MSKAIFSTGMFFSPDNSLQKARRNVFQRLLQALHHSRRLQARRTLRHYQFLIDQERHRTVQSNTGGGDNVSQ